MKTGVGIITCDRPELLEKCLASLPESDLVVIVNDGKPLQVDLTNYKIDFLIEHEERYGVAQGKNDALELLMQEGCDHIFLIEDDIAIKHESVFKSYIHAANISGILHFNYCIGNFPHRRYSVKYRDGTSISFYRNLNQPFTYLHRSVVSKVGFYDTAFYNALEDVDYTYRVIQEGFHPPYWWFADISTSKSLLLNLDPTYSKSVVRSDQVLYRCHLEQSVNYFLRKHGVHPAKIFDEPQDVVKRSLGELFKRSKEMELMSESSI